MVTSAVAQKKRCFKFSALQINIFLPTEGKRLIWPNAENIKYQLDKGDFYMQQKLLVHKLCIYMLLKIKTNGSDLSQRLQNETAQFF